MMPPDNACSKQCSGLPHVQKPVYKVLSGMSLADRSSKKRNMSSISSKNCASYYSTGANDMMTISNHVLTVLRNPVK